MSSILTNTSAMVALQTMRGINMNMAQTQSEISTGKSISTAKDNASIWAISKVMESDVKGFNTISSNLALGESTVSVARAAAETVTDLLTDIKGKIVDAQQDNKDRGKIQTDIEALRDQIKSVVSAAQFNGLNLVDGRMTDQNGTGSIGIDVLSSLDRAGDGSVVASQIAVNAANMSTTAGTDVSGAASVVASAVFIEDGGSFTVDLAAFKNGTDTGAYVAGESIDITLGGETLSVTAPATPDDANFTAAVTTALAGNTTAAAEWTAAVSGSTITFTNVSGADSSANATGADNGADGTAANADDVALGASQLITSTADAEGNETSELQLAGGANISFGVADITLQGTGGALASDDAAADRADASGLIAGDEVKLNIDSVAIRYVVQEGDTAESIVAGLNDAAEASALNTSEYSLALTTGATGALTVTNNTNEAVGYSFEISRGAGDLAGLEKLDVSTDQGAADALADVEAMIDSAIQASADFGSAQGRLETQQTFVSKLTDSLRAGIGSLVDADMEETSARLQSLQVQQQLGVQALSIANQQPQMLLSLFR